MINLVIVHTLIDMFVFCIYHLQYGDDDYDMDDEYDDYSKELNQYRKSKDRGRGEFKRLHHSI